MTNPNINLNINPKKDEALSPPSLHNQADHIIPTDLHMKEDSHPAMTLIIAPVISYSILSGIAKVYILLTLRTSKVS